MTEVAMQTLQTGLMITFIGMTSVLLFLIIMIFSMQIMEKVVKFINEKFPEEVKEEPKKVKTQSKGDEEIAVAIAAALSFTNKA